MEDDGEVRVKGACFFFSVKRVGSWIILQLAIEDFSFPSMGCNAIPTTLKALLAVLPGLTGGMSVPTSHLGIGDVIP